MRRQLEEELSSVREELKIERTSDRGYLDSLGGQRFIKSCEDAAVFKYKESMEFQFYRDSIISKFRGSDDFEHVFGEASVPVFDECLAFCQEQLINSGRFPEEKFEFLDSDWVEMIDIPHTEDLGTAQASQGTRLLPVPGVYDDVMIDIEGKVVAL